MHDLTCQHCSVSFSSYIATQKYCGRPCSSMAGRVTRSCAFCGGDFNAPKSRKKLYCDRLCSNRAIAASKKVDLVELTCEVCSKKFSIKPHIAKRNRRFCSRDCGCKNMGKNNVLKPKSRPCVTCGVAVSVARNASDSSVHCADHMIVLSDDEERTCIGCDSRFTASKGRRKTQRFCSKTCACRDTGKNNESLLKTSPCCGPDCEEQVVVPRSTAGTRVFCVGCKTVRKVAARRRTYVRVKHRKVEETLEDINKPADIPYEGYTLLNLHFDGHEQHWFVSMRHEGRPKNKKVLLAEYILSVQIGRTLRGNESPSWLDGDETNDSPTNLAIVRKVAKIGKQKLREEVRLRRSYQKYTGTT